MSANPQWTSTLGESKVWSLTDTNLWYWHAFDDDGRALCNRRIRSRGHRENDTTFRTVSSAQARLGTILHDRCREKAEAKVAAHPEAQKWAAELAANEAERAEAKRQDQLAMAVRLFADVHPAANRLVESLEENALTTAHEGSPEFTPGDVWGQIGAEPGRDYGHDDGETNEVMPEALLKVWEHINRRAQAGELNTDRWEDLLTEARDVMAYAYEQPGPAALDKTPDSWQVLWHTDSPLTGENWAGLPVHSVVRTAQLRAGQTWDVVDQRLMARGLSRYGVRAVSAGHALNLARERWRAEGPHAAWFAFLDENAEEIESVRAEYDPTPEQERDAFTTLTAAFDPAAPVVTFAELRAIAHGTA